MSAVYYLQIGYDPPGRNNPGWRRRGFLLGVWNDPGEAEAVSIEINRIIYLPNINGMSRSRKLDLLWGVMEPYFERKVLGYGSNHLEEGEDPDQTDLIYVADDVDDLLDNRHVTFNVFEFNTHSPRY